MASRPSALRRLALALLAIGLAIAALELGSWLVFWGITGRAFSWAAIARERAALLERFAPADAPGREAPAVVVHPYVGHVRNPDRIPGLTQFGYPESTVVPCRRSPERVIVAVLGGSVATHFAAEAMPGVTEALKQLPLYREREFAILNFAGGGYKQPQQLMILNYLLALGSEFDIVVNLDGFNEVALHGAENASKGVFPAFPRGWFELSANLRDPQLEALERDVRRREAQLTGWAETFSRFPLRTSVVANVLWLARHRRLLEAHYAATARFQQHGVEDPPYQRTGPRVRFADEAALTRHLVDLWFRGSLQLHRLCAANGIRYYHFLQPNQYDAGSKPLGDAERRLAYREDHVYRTGVERGYPLLREVGRRLVREGVRFGDLSRIFVAEPRPVYRDTCCHLNARGQAALAAEVTRVMLRDHAAEAGAADLSPAASPAPPPRE